ncbi:hypothetical protein SAMD00019534_082660, partial [Acytostelium subglobosum LB1]|uniref:hypothetical protein n=1 Tax=Acytostelium subglobosum LB1 TaxID=1410327 RepID=UPI000644F062
TDINKEMIDQVLESFTQVNFSETYFLASIAVTVGLPTWWNIVARQEYNTHFLTRLCGGPYRGCYFLAFLIFSCSLVRDYMFKEAITHQARLDLLDCELVRYIAYGLFAVGAVFVLSSYLRLGITGTYLGDYFGILMKERVTGFPFNVMSNPMYNGATMMFLATALWECSPAGIILVGVVFVVYRIALIFEEDFTHHIYASQAQKKKATAK